MPPRPTTAAADAGGSRTAVANDHHSQTRHHNHQHHHHHQRQLQQHARVAPPVMHPAAAAQQGYNISYGMPYDNYGMQHAPAYQQQNHYYRQPPLDDNEHLNATFASTGSPAMHAQRPADYRPPVRSDSATNVQNRSNPLPGIELVEIQQQAHAPKRTVSTKQRDPIPAVPLYRLPTTVVQRHHGTRTPLNQQAEPVGGILTSGIAAPLRPALPDRIIALPPQSAHHQISSTNVENVMTGSRPPFHGSSQRDMQGRLLSRKATTMRRVQLTAQGNLVVDFPVPTRVLDLGRYNAEPEFTTMRYTACTVDPDEFVSAGYSLRQQEMGRAVELFIVVTMYNEGEELFCKTMVALMKNIAYLCSRAKSSTWGPNGWQRVVICIVSDGRAKINSRVLHVLGVMGVYQDDVMKNSVNGKDVTAHLFEYTSQIVVDTDMTVMGHTHGVVPLQILFCLKERNLKKINSHRWFFNAFSAFLHPNVCILIDVGTKPNGTALYHLWKAFDRNPSVGGACGEIYADLGNGCKNLLNPIVAAQNFEYKMSNILDKPLESVLGYISVLPGAFSAYRYDAVCGEPLKQYFRGEAMHDGNNIFAANMYLAEDRILCFELITKANESWLLRYVRKAKAETDVPDSVPEFISQRRRWLNGSFFAALHALTHFYYIFRSHHNPFRKFVLCVEFLYNLITMAFNWFGIANFYMIFYFLGTDVVRMRDGAEGVSPLGPSPISDYVFLVLRQTYIMSIALVFVCSLGNRPQGSKLTYTMCMCLFAIIMGVILYLVGFDLFLVIRDAHPTASNFGRLLSTYPSFRDLCLSISATSGLYVLASLLYLDPWHMFTSFIAYMFMLPSYVNILMVYAFCNLHDVSWGTKGDNIVVKDLGVVTSSKGIDGKQSLEIEVTGDMDDGYDRFVISLNQAKAKRGKTVVKPDSKTAQEDYFRNFRTRVILWWMFSNALVIIVLTSDALSSTIYSAIGLHATEINPYLKFIFYSVLGLSAFRFVGSMMYLLTSLAPC